MPIERGKSRSRLMVPAPVIEGPGSKPKLPLMVVALVLVTVEAPNTVKLSAVPSIVEAVALPRVGITAMRPSVAVPQKRELVAIADHLSVVALPLLLTRSAL
jgi:hypothetical protein